MIKRILANVALTCISIALTVFVLEISVRLFFSLPEIASHVWYVPQLSNLYNEQSFFERNKGKNLDQYPYDPLLGWDYNKHNARARGPLRARLEKTPGTLRVLVIGDSYALGHEVEDEEAFPYLCGEMLPNVEVINMGANGYGVDQAALKYLRYGQEFKPDVVVFAVHPPDYIRAELDFFSYRKPRLVVDSGAPEGHRWINTPVPTPDASMKQLGWTNILKPRLYYLALRKLSNIRVFRDRWKQQYYERMDPVVERCLSIVRDEVVQRGGSFVLVDIPSGRYLLNPRHDNDYRHRLRAIYSRVAPDWIDLRTIWSNRKPLADIADSHFIRYENGGFGHLSPEGNRSVADILTGRLRSLLPDRP